MYERNSTVDLLLQLTCFPFNNSFLLLWPYLNFSALKKNNPRKPTAFARIVLHNKQCHQPQLCTWKSNVFICYSIRSQSKASGKCHWFWIIIEHKSWSIDFRTQPWGLFLECLNEAWESKTKPQGCICQHEKLQRKGHKSASTANNISKLKKPKMQQMKAVVQQFLLKLFKIVFKNNASVSLSEPLFMFSPLWLVKRV